MFTLAALVLLFGSGPMIVLAVILLIGLALALFIVEEKIPADMHWSGKLVLLPWLWIGFALDVDLLNWLLGSIAFLEPPHELTLSARVRRHEHNSAGYRKRLAQWICNAYLQPVDDGHC